MSARLLPVLAFILLMVSTGCHSATPDATLDSSRLEIQSSTIPVDQLPSTFDPARTFHYRVGRVEDPRSLLVDLWDLGLQSSRAWQPLDDRCNDPVGPQFTVELLRDDPRMIDHGFVRGDGRLHCSTTLTRYTISRNGS